MRVAAFDDGERMALERHGRGVIMRVLLPNVDAQQWTILKDTLGNGNMPWLCVDKSGLLVELQRKASIGVTLKGGGTMGKALQALPLAEQLPGNLSWDDFSPRQKLALALITDLDTQRSLQQVAVACEVEVEELRKWENLDKFLKAKKWLLERNGKGMAREKGLKGIIEGCDSMDASERIAARRACLEVAGLVGKNATTVVNTGPNVGVPPEVAEKMASLSPKELKEWVNDLPEQVSIDANGRMVEKNPQDSDT